MEDSAGRERIDYDSMSLSESEAGDDPLVLLRRWIDEAGSLPEPNAMAVASADEDGRPSVRMVLLKAWDDRGLVFFTNFHSRKAGDFAANPHAAAVIHWQPIHRQVRVEGAIERIDDADSDAYFASRPRGAQVGAIVSEQSKPIGSRAELERRVAAIGVSRVSRPANWGGYRIALEVIEFWQGRPDRLHDRIRFAREGEGWVRERLQP